MRWAANTAMAVTPTVISASHLSSPNQGFRCGGRSGIGMSSHPLVSMGIDTTSGAFQSLRVMLTGRSWPRLASSALSRAVAFSRSSPGEGSGTSVSPLVSCLATRRNISI